MEFFSPLGFFGQAGTCVTRRMNRSPLPPHVRHVYVQVDIEMRSLQDAFTDTHLFVRMEYLLLLPQSTHAPVLSYRTAFTSSSSTLGAVSDLVEKNFRATRQSDKPIPMPDFSLPNYGSITDTGSQDADFQPK